MDNHTTSPIFILHCDVFKRTKIVELPLHYFNSKGYKRDVFIRPVKMILLADGMTKYQANDLSAELDSATRNLLGICSLVCFLQ